MHSFVRCTYTTNDTQRSNKGLAFSNFRQIPNKTIALILDVYIAIKERNVNKLMKKFIKEVVLIPNCFLFTKLSTKKNILSFSYLEAYIYMLFLLFFSTISSSKFNYYRNKWLVKKTRFRTFRLGQICDFSLLDLGTA